MVFEVTQESEGGYVAKCLGEDILTKLIRGMIFSRMC